MAEADRAVVIGQVAEKRLRQREAADRLGLSVRQVKRLLARYRERGPAGLVSGHRGKVSNNAMAGAVRRAAMELVRERYADFGPTFACEKLVEVHGHRLSVETLRKWMIAAGPVAGEGAAGGARAPEPAEACVRGGPGADRWLAARVVRGARAGVHADRVCGRRHDAACGDGVFRRGDDRGVHGDDARASGGARSAGGVLLGPVRCVPGQQEGPGGRADAVHAGVEDAGHRGDPRAQPPGEGARGTGQSNAPGPAGEGDAAARDRRHGGGQRVPGGSSWRTSTGASRWRRGTHRTRTARCCTTRRSWT